MAFVTTTDDVKISYHDEGDGPSVVLVGGYGMAASGWTLQRRALVDDHRVVSVDRRSHGDSEHVTRGQRMARHARDVEEVLAELDIDDAIFMGASMGASVIWAYVDVFGTDRLRAVISVDQTPKMVNDDGWQFGMYDLGPDDVEPFVNEFPGDLNPFHQMPPVEVVGMMRGGEPPHADLRPVLREHAWADWRDVIERIDVPVLAIAGRHSPMWPWESSEFIASASSDGDLVVLDGSGHVPFLEQPDAFNEALLGFTSRHR